MFYSFCILFINKKNHSIAFCGDFAKECMSLSLANSLMSTRYDRGFCYTFHVQTKATRVTFTQAMEQCAKLVDIAGFTNGTVGKSSLALPSSRKQFLMKQKLTRII